MCKNVNSNWKEMAVKPWSDAYSVLGRSFKRTSYEVRGNVSQQRSQKAFDQNYVAFVMGNKIILFFNVLLADFSFI